MYDKIIQHNNEMQSQSQKWLVDVVIEIIYYIYIYKIICSGDRSSFVCYVITYMTMGGSMIVGWKRRLSYARNRNNCWHLWDHRVPQLRNGTNFIATNLRFCSRPPRQKDIHICLIGTYCFGIGDAFKTPQFNIRKGVVSRIDRFCDT